MVQTTEILKILHGMQHDLQAIDQKHTLLLSHTKAQKEKADQDLTAGIAAQEQALKSQTGSCLDVLCYRMSGRTACLFENK